MKDGQRETSDTRRVAVASAHCIHCRGPLVVPEGETLLAACCPLCGTGTEHDPDQTVSIDSSAPRWLDKFQLIRPLGQGTFGTVYLALDTELMRPVAVKVPRSGTFATPQDEERFMREARSVAKLRDPGVVMVHEVGRSDAFPYIVCEYVEGVTLADALTARDFDPRQAAELVAQVAMTVEHAHQQGVVHRDLKPSNIMLEPLEGSTSAEATRDDELRGSRSGSRSSARGSRGSNSPPLDVRPRVLDFGLARRDDAEGVMTLEGQVLGTPAYMSPEQAKGRGHFADARSDVYALGVILFEVLTGERPFRGNARMLLHQVIRDEPPSPRKLSSGIPRDLETICLRCLQKDPSRRFQTAQDLVEELHRFLRGEPVLSRPVGRIERAVRWTRRHPVESGLLLLLLLSMLTGTLVSLWFGIDAQRQAELARAEKHRADDELRLNERLLSDSYLNLAQSEWRFENPQGALRYLQSIPTDARGWEFDFLYRQVHHNRRHLGEHGGHIACVAFRPDGRRLVSAGGDNPLRVWDVDSGNELLRLRGHKGPVHSVAYSSDGERIASAGEDATIRIWDAASGRPLAVLEGHARPVRSVVFSPDARHVVSGSDDYTALVWNIESRQVVRRLDGHNGPVQCVAVSPDGSLIASGSRDDTVKLWQFETGITVHSLRGHEDDVHCVAFRHDGRQLVSGGGDLTSKSNGELTIWDVKTGRAVRHILGHAGPIYSVNWSEDDRRLVSGGADNTVRLWEPQTGKVMATLRGHSDAVHSVAFSPDGRWIVSGGADQSLAHWDTQPGSAVWTLDGHTDAVTCAAFTTDGETIATGSEDGTVRFWRARSGQLVGQVLNVGSPVLAVAYRPDGKELATSGADKTVRIWNVGTGTQVCPAFRLDSEVLSLDYAPGGNLLLTGGRDDTVRVWDLATGVVSVNLRGHTDDVQSVAYSPDGARVLSGSTDGTARVWDAQTGALRHELIGHLETIWCVAWSKHGRRVATASEDGTLRVWDAGTGEPLAVLQGHTSGFSSVAFHPRGNRLVSGGLDSTVRLWNLETRQESLTLRRHKQPVLTAGFSPDGRQILSGGMDHTAVLWDGTPDSAVPRQAERQNRPAPE